MSKNTNVKAAAQGGGDGSGSGGLPGTWILVDSGFTPISAGQTITLASVSSPVVGEEILLVIISGDAGPVAHIAPGSTQAAPATDTIVYDQVGNGANTDIVARSGGAIPALNLTWAIYKVILP